MCALTWFILRAPHSSSIVPSDDTTRNTSEVRAGRVHGGRVSRSMHGRSGIQFRGRCGAAAARLRESGARSSTGLRLRRGRFSIIGRDRDSTQIEASSAEWNISLQRPNLTPFKESRSLYRLSSDSNRFPDETRSHSALTPVSADFGPPGRDRHRNATSLSLDLCQIGALHSLHADSALNVGRRRRGASTEPTVYLSIVESTGTRSYDRCARDTAR